MKKIILSLLFLALLSVESFATFNVITDGDPVLATPIMQNFRHVNYGNVLKPVDTTGVNSSATLDLGTSTVLWRDGWFSRSGLFGTSVGIGTTTPSQALSVVGNATISSGSTYKINGTDVLSATTLGSGVVNSSLTSVGTIATGVWSGTAVGVTKGGTGTTTQFTANSVVFAGGSGVYSQDASNLVWDDSNNRLGIGITNPAQPLSILSTTGVMATIQRSADTNWAAYGIKDAAGTIIGYFGAASSSGGGMLVSGLANQVGIITDGTAAIYLGPAGTMSGGVTILSNGKVGIGKSAPAQVLDVEGNATISSGSTYKINGTDVLSATTLGSGVVNSSLTSVGTMLGIGITNPTNNLQVQGTIRGTSSTMTAQPTCIIYNTGNQNAIGASGTVTTWNAESYDPTGMHSTVSNTERITVVDSGTYLTSIQTSFSMSASSKTYYTELIKNGSLVLAFSSNISYGTGGNFYAHVNFTSMDRLVAGDYLTVKIYDLTTGGGNKIVGSFFSTAKLH